MDAFLSTIRQPFDRWTRFAVQRLPPFDSAGRTQADQHQAVTRLSLSRHYATAMLISIAWRSVPEGLSVRRAACGSTSIRFRPLATELRE